MYGLLERDLKCILQAIRNYPEIQEVIIFGSRAMGNFKTGSDVDLALKGKVDRKTINRLSDDLNEEQPLPHFFRVISYEDISNRELKDHIDTVGKRIYQK